MAEYTYSTTALVRSLCIVVVTVSAVAAMAVAVASYSATACPTAAAPPWAQEY